MTDLSHPHSIQIIGIIFSLFLFFSVVFLVRGKRMKEKYSIIWLFIAVFIFIISLFRDFMDWFSNLIGIYYAPSAFFSILISLSYLLLLSVSISVSTLRKHNKSLIQEIGLLKLKVEELEEKLKRSEEE